MCNIGAWASIEWNIGTGLLAFATVVITGLSGIGLIIAIPLWLFLIYDAYWSAKSINQNPTQINRSDKSKKIRE